MRDRRHIESGAAGKSFLIALLFLALVACSTKSSTKPPDTTAMQPQQKAGTTKQIKTVASNSGSSLDAHREGKAPTSGPLKDIYFDFDQYNLRADARDVLKSHSGWLKNSASAQVEIEGYCDERGTGEYNLALGRKAGANGQRLSRDVGHSGWPDHHDQLWEGASGLPGAQ